MEISVIGSNPDGLTIARRLADGVDRGVHLRIGIVDSYAAGFFLFLFLRVIRSEIWRDAVPRLTVVAGAEQELCADVNRALLIGAHVDRSVPVETQLPFPVIGLRLDEPGLERESIHSTDLAAL